ncbi:MAG: hypothetical protein O7B35_01070 [Deltaproteobacteria bacterium]|nr:hypothetical protein [Deltaproteobacteria bacterium]
MLGCLAFRLQVIPDVGQRKKRWRAVKDCEVIKAFVAYLRVRGHLGLRIESRPDKENRESSDIDAISGEFALEHTSVDTLPNQRRDADWFTCVVSGLEDELSTSPSCRLRITLEYHAVSTGQDWLSIREALKIWITHEVPHLADGSHVTNSSDRPHGLFFARYKPVDDTLPARIRTQFDRKAQKLAKYQNAGKTTVLLVENSDIALMNDQKMLEAIRRAYPDGLPVGVDELWYADTAILDNIDFNDFTAMLGGMTGRGDR